MISNEVVLIVGLTVIAVVVITESVYAYLMRNRALKWYPVGTSIKFRNSPYCSAMSLYEDGTPLPDKVRFHVADMYYQSKHGRVVVDMITTDCNTSLTERLDMYCCDFHDMMVKYTSLFQHRSTEFPYNETLKK